MRVLITILGFMACLYWPSSAQAQSLLESTDASQINALIRAKLCEKSCRYGALKATRYTGDETGDEIKTANRFKLYVIKASGRACTARGCAEAFMAINKGSVVRLAEGVDVSFAKTKIPAKVGKRTVQQASGPRNGIACEAPGRRMNTALLKQTFLGKTMHGITAKGSKWSETLQENGRTSYVNARGKVSIGRYLIAGNNICYKYRAGQDYQCKAIYECTSGEGLWVLTNRDRKLNSVITHVFAEQSATAAKPKPKPEPKPQAQGRFDPLKPLVPGDAADDIVASLGTCRAITSDLRRLNCYDKLAAEAKPAPPRFGRKSRDRLTKLMTFRNASGVTLTRTVLKGCTLTIKVDAPEVKFSFANESVINLVDLDLQKSRRITGNQDALFSFVAKDRKAWPLKTIDKSRKSERTSRNPEALLAVTADPKDLLEAARLIKRLASICQR